MASFDVLFAYIGPDVAMPVATVLASVFGFALMVGRAPFRFAARGLRSIARGVRSIGKGSGPQAPRPPEAP